MKPVRSESMDFEKCHSGERWLPVPSPNNPTHNPCPQGNRFELSDIPTCFIKPPFWWRGSLEFPSRPNGNPNDYKPKRRILPIPPEIPGLLGRLELDDIGYYLPGQVANGL